MEAPHANPRAVLEDAATAAISSLMAQAGGPVWDEASFNRLRDFVAGRAADETARIVAQTVKILQAARAVRARLDTLRGAAFDEVRRDVAQQLGRLVFPGFITPTGAARLADVERYLRGADWRLERLHKAAAVDRDRMRAIQELEDLYRRRLEELPAGRQRRRRAERGALAARGAADEPVRAGDRLQGSGLQPQDPPDPRRGPLTTTTRRGGSSRCHHHHPIRLPRLMPVAGLLLRLRRAVGVLSGVAHYRLIIGIAQRLQPLR